MKVCRFQARRTASGSRSSTRTTNSSKVSSSSTATWCGSTTSTAHCSMWPRLPTRSRRVRPRARSRTWLAVKTPKRSCWRVVTWASSSAVPAAKPEPADRRFSAPDWQRNAAYDAVKQSYLLSATALLKSAAALEGLDAAEQRKLQFYLRQFVDAISPSNFLFTNPQVIHETIESGGQNLVKGMRHLLRDIGTGEVKITDTEAFEVGRNLAITPGQVVYRNELIVLIQYTPMTEQAYSIPLLFAPPWINKFYI